MDDPWLELVQRYHLTIGFCILLVGVELGLVIAQACIWINNGKPKTLPVQTIDSEAETKVMAPIYGEDF